LLFAPFGAKLGFLPGASHAFASGCFDECIEIIAAIVIGDLIAGLDVLDRPNLDDVFYEIDLGIRSARMIDIARPVSAVVIFLPMYRTMNCPFLIGTSVNRPRPDRERAIRRCRDGDSLAGMRLECLVDGDVPMMIDRRRGTVSQMRARLQFARDELGN
jgi:hypothetical protein